MPIFPIEQIPNITGGKQCWLDANDISTVVQSGNAVSQWNDKSGRNRNATQGTGANQPTYTANAQNNMFGISFDGTNDSLSVTASVQLNPNTSGYSVFVVTKYLQPSGSAFFLSKGNGTSGTVGWSLVNSVSGIRGSSATPVNFTISNVYISPSSVYNILSLTFDGSTCTGYLNNASVGTGSYSGSINSGSNLVISAGPSSTVFGTQIILEIFFANRLLSASQVVSMNRYFANKWGLPI